MKYFYIVVNKDNKEARKAAKEISKYLKDNGGEDIWINDGNHKKSCKNEKYRYTNPDMVPDNTEVIIVLGGDGTLLQTARDLGHKEIPLIGINFGNLGFLAENDKDHIMETLDRLLKDEFSEESRMMIQGSVIRDGNKICNNIALNDIVISRNGSLAVIDFKIYVNGQYLNTYRADGIIISTPTGSTAYNLSAGGPIVNPSANLIVVTPICPHTLNARSIILDKDDEILIEIPQGRREYSGSTMASFDGDEEIALNNNDKIFIRKSENDIKIVKLNSISFLQVLRRKMAGNENSETK